MRPQLRRASRQFFLGKRSYPEVERLGDPHSYWGDLYHLLLTMPWPAFIFLTSALYLLVNALFAIAYSLGGGIATVDESDPAYFLELFFFSIQTMASIGYGAMYPTNIYAHWLVVIEALISLFFIAATTGLVFARFSIPTARMLFSNVAVVAPFNGTPTLKFRTANKRKNYILEAQLWVTLVRDEISQEGERMRRFYDLDLVRSHTPLFSLTWTAMHQLTQSSPLYSDTLDTLHRDNAQIIVTITGLDETLSQTIHARHEFRAGDIFWNYRFVDILHRAPGGRRVIDFRKFHSIEPVEEARFAREAELPMPSEVPISGHENGQTSGYENGQEVLSSLGETLSHE